MSNWYYESDGKPGRRTHYLTNDKHERMDFSSKEHALQALERMTDKPKPTEVVFTSSGREYHCDAGWENDGAYGALKSKGKVRLYHSTGGDTCLTLEHPVYLKSKYIEAQGTIK